MRKSTASTKARWIGTMGGIGLVLSIWGATWGQQPPTGRPAPAIEAPEKPQDRSHPAKARLDLAQEALRILQRMQASGQYGGQSEFDDAYRWSCRAIEARKELGGDQADLIAALEAHLALMKKWESVAKIRYDRGEIKAIHMLDVQYRLAEAESWLAEAKADR